MVRKIVIFIFIGIVSLMTLNFVNKALSAQPPGCFDWENSICTRWELPSGVCYCCSEGHPEKNCLTDPEW